MNRSVSMLLQHAVKNNINKLANAYWLGVSGNHFGQSGCCWRKVSGCVCQSLWIEDVREKTSKEAEFTRLPCPGSQILFCVMFEHCEAASKSADGEECSILVVVSPVFAILLRSEHSLRRYTSSPMLLPRAAFTLQPGFHCRSRC